MMHETEGQTIARRAREALTACQQKENELRRQLAEAVASTRKARETFERVFLEEEKREAARLKKQNKV